MNVFRRLPLTRLLLGCGLAVAIGVSGTALAFALGAGPTPPPRPLAQAIHDALGGETIEGVSASIQFTNHLLEGASLDGGGQGGGLASGPLVNGASGRLWIARDGRMRIELQSEAGDTEIVYDGRTLQLYDAATNTLYRYTPHAPSTPRNPPASDRSASAREAPSVERIETAISHLREHAEVSSATPTDVAGQPAYTVRVSPREGGSLFGAAELSFDADNGAPLRAAVYPSNGSSPAIELAASEISFGPVAESVFALTPPANVKVEEVKLPEHDGEGSSSGSARGERPKLTTYGHGPSTIAVLESSGHGEGKSGAGTGSEHEDEPISGLPKVTIDGASASELRTELGTLLSFQRSGVRYLLVGSVTPAAIEALARGL